MQLESTGNTEKEAENALNLKRVEIQNETNVKFKEIKCYGNFELGYKLVQEYEYIIK